MIGLILDIVEQGLKLLLVLTGDLLAVTLVQQFHHLHIDLEADSSAHIIAIFLQEGYLSL